MNLPIIIIGVVSAGKSRGKELGFPTINIPLSFPLPEGIYLSQTTLNDQIYNSLTFIGAAKTYNETTVQAEAYLFDFDNDIYGEQVSITLLKKIRENQKFDSEEALIKQMEKDKRQAEEYFNNT